MVKTLMKQIKEYKKDSLLTMLFATLEVVLEIMIPLLMASLIDKGIEAGNMSNVTKYGALMFAGSVSTIVNSTFSETETFNNNPSKNTK